MSTNKINAELLAKMFLAGAKNLEVKKEWINELNVFPVPDGDTGTNMTMTIMAAAREVAAIENPTMESIAKALSSGSLRGARGNSGVITSQIFRGIYQGVEGLDVVNGAQLARALVTGSRVAYRAVMRPVEGTILTVVREAADYTYAYAMDQEDVSCEAVMAKMLEESKASLERTPELLPVLPARAMGWP